MPSKHSRSVPNAFCSEMPNNSCARSFNISTPAAISKNSKWPAVIAAEWKRWATSHTRRERQSRAGDEPFSILPGGRPGARRRHHAWNLVLHSALQVDLRILPKNSYGAALNYFTGSKAHNIALRSLGVERGLRISEYGIYRLPKGVKPEDLEKAPEANASAVPTSQMSIAT